MKSEEEKAKEILRKRELAEKGLKERGDGKPIDPMKDANPLALDIDPDDPETNDDKQDKVAERGIGIGLGLKR
jgi:hypothetical protein